LNFSLQLLKHANVSLFFCFANKMSKKCDEMAFFIVSGSAHSSFLAVLIFNHFLTIG